MPSIDDVYNQLVAVNGKLSQLHTDDITENTSVNAVKASVDTLDNDVKAGFAATVHGLNVLSQINIEAVKLLFHLTQQTDTMICALEHISQNTCGILTQTTIQTRLQEAIRADADMLRDLAESTNPAATLELARLTALRKQIERCCPPEVQPPACTYQPCPAVKPVPMPDLPKIPPSQNPTTSVPR